MRVTITARHIPVPDPLKELLERKVLKLEHFGHKLMSIHAILGREKYQYTAELTLFARGFTLVGKSKGDGDLLTCVEEALMKLKHQLQRREEKRVESRRRVPHRPA